MKYQHCGRLRDHDQHKFTSVEKVVVERCTCDDNPCTCRPNLVTKPRIERPRQSYICPGKLITEGAPAHMPVRVSV